MPDDLVEYTEEGQSPYLSGEVSVKYVDFIAGTSNMPPSCGCGKERRILIGA